MNTASLRSIWSRQPSVPLAATAPTVGSWSLTDSKVGVGTLAVGAAAAVGAGAAVGGAGAAVGASAAGAPPQALNNMAATSSSSPKGLSIFKVVLLCRRLETG